MRNRKILCPVDFSETAHVALFRAVELAGESGGKLTLLHVYQAPSTDGIVYAPQMLGEMQAAAERGLAEWAAQAQALGVTADTVVLMGVPWQETVNLAQSRGCDLIVVGTHGRTGLKRALIGSVAEKVVRHAPCAVLVVRWPDKG